MNFKHSLFLNLVLIESIWRFESHKALCENVTGKVLLLHEIQKHFTIKNWDWNVPLTYVF